MELSKFSKAKKPSTNTIVKLIRESVMKVKVIRLIVIALLILTNHSLYAATGSVTGVINKVVVYGDGKVLVTGTGLVFSGASCSNIGGFYIPGDHPNMQRLLSQILTAKAMGSELDVVAKTDNCWYPEITQNNSTYIVLK